MDYIQEAEVGCPHCWEPVLLAIDTSQGDQTMTEDCSVCCRPMLVSVRCRPGEIMEISAEGQ